MEKPILFNTEMVKAILEDRKSCTRRVIKKKYSNTDIEFHEDKYGKRLIEIQNDAPKPVVHPDGSKTVHLVACEEIKKPYEVGDILYARETWQESECFDYSIKNKYGYKANVKDEELAKEHSVKWRPSIHMPKKAARIFLKVKDVRAERLQDITEGQIEKEGIKEEFPPLAQDEFRNLWDSTLKKDQLKMYGWDANPWVWVIQFEVLQNV